MKQTLQTTDTLTIGSNYLLHDKLSRLVNNYLKMVTVKLQFILMQFSGHIIAIKQTSSSDVS
jgi:hypothetical protein